MPTSLGNEARVACHPACPTARAALALFVAGTFLTACIRHTRSPADAPAGNTPVSPTRKTPASRTIAALPPIPEQRLGVVRIIGTRASFVLIETPSASVTAAAPAGHILHCRPPGVMAGPSTADLRVSTERRPPFVIADVLAGTPMVGDIAYLARDNDPVPVLIRPVVPFSSVIPTAEPSASPASVP